MSCQEVSLASGAAAMNRRDRYRIRQCLAAGDMGRHREECRGIPAAREEHIAGWIGNGIEKDRLKCEAGR